MPKRYCKCPNEHCFDRATQCVSCDPEDLDPEGYPRRARRRLTNEENGMVVDIDTKQEFRVKTVKGGKRLVPGSWLQAEVMQQAGNEPRALEYGRQAVAALRERRGRLV